MNYVYMTVFSDERYLPGVRGLVHSLKKVRSQHAIYVLLPESKKDQLSRLIQGDKYLSSNCSICTQPDVVASDVDENQQNHYWNNTFFKLSVFGCTQFDKILLLDSDMMVLKNIDHLFNYPSISGCVGGQSMEPESRTVNSGLLIIEPNQSLCRKLIGNISDTICDRRRNGYNAGDQDVIHKTFPDWQEHTELLIPEQYNAFWDCIELLQSRKYITHNQIMNIHFIGAVKPWEKSIVKDHIKSFLVWLKHGKFWRIRVYFTYLLFCKK